MAWFGRGTVRSTELVSAPSDSTQVATSSEKKSSTIAEEIVSYCTGSVPGSAGGDQISVVVPISPPLWSSVSPDVSPGATHGAGSTTCLPR